MMQAILANKRVQAGLAFIEADHERTISEQKEIVLIEAPTFHEEKRARDYARRLRELGLRDVHIDEHGNALGRRPGRGQGSWQGPVILLEAHLDTVFPFGTDVKPVEREGKIYAPGICDDTRGLAANLCVIRALDYAGIETVGDIVFAGTTREEGMGGLAGMRGLLLSHPEIAASVSIDGAGVDSIVYQATGIRNFAVTYMGPGGHAYGAFGLPSPVHAAARAVALLSDLRPPILPKTTFTVSLIEGGHQIHAIAEQASFKINMRSDDGAELDKFEAEAIAAFEQGAALENARWGRKAVTVTYEKILDAPAGTQPRDAAIVQLAWQATEALGITPRLEAGGCTNTNIPVSMGIPAVTLGRGGKEGGIHSLGEWFDPTGTYRCPQKSFLLLIALAGLAGAKPSCEAMAAAVPVATGVLSEW
ncbi:MAG: Carboxypeptidase G2 [Firmicutes bacterium]|nr:Carboxypeptidase G2 [candidate division NPL-UPA2 bacterium]